MKRGLSHPLWTHIPAIVALCVLVAALATAHVPASAPVHYGPGGEPDRYGSPVAVFALIIGLSVGFVVLSVWLDELWARQERHKSFNYFALLDEIVVGAMAGQGLGYLRLLQQSAAAYAAPVQELLWFIVPAVAGAVALEHLRPRVAIEFQPEREDITAFRREMTRTVRAGMPFAYSDIQNPAYVTLLTTLLPATMLVSAILQAAVAPLWSTFLLAAVGLLAITLYGGIRTTVTPDSITVHLGTPGYRALRLSASDIADVALRDYMPLKEFGGYGIRANRQMQAYYMSGGTGVLLTTREGKKHLIGSNRPERLAEVVRAVAHVTIRP